MKRLNLKRRRPGRPVKYLQGEAPRSLTIRVPKNLEVQILAARRLIRESKGRILTGSATSGGLRAYVLSVLKADAQDKSKDLRLLSIKPGEIWGDVKAV